MKASLKLKKGPKQYTGSYKKNTECKQTDYNDTSYVDCSTITKYFVDNKSLNKHCEIPRVRKYYNKVHRVHNDHQKICCNKCNHSNQTIHCVPNNTPTPTNNTNNHIQLELTDQFKILINARTGSHVINIQRPNGPNKIYNIAKASPEIPPTINYVMAVGEQDSKIELRWDNTLDIRLTNNINSGLYTITWL